MFWGDKSGGKSEAIRQWLETNPNGINGSVHDCIYQIWSETGLEISKTTFYAVKKTMKEERHNASASRWATFHAAHAKVSFKTVLAGLLADALEQIEAQRLMMPSQR
jgi:hypothetical protein